MIITRTPFRISFFGGGTDYPEWFRENGGAVLATSIDKYCYLTVRYLPPFFEHRYRIVYSIVEMVKEIDEIRHPAVRAVLKERNFTKGLEIHHDGDLPARSGLGSSSSFAVGILHALDALDGRMQSKLQLAREAIRMEQEVLQETVGCQDQITAAFGGFNRIRFLPDSSFDVEPIVIGRERLDTLQQSLMLCFTGLTRHASAVAQETVKNFDAKRNELTAMRQMVDEAVEMLCGRADPIENFGRLLHEAWLIKRGLATNVTTSKVDEIYEAARSAGAIGGKLLGAGSGGFILLVAPPDRHAAIRERLNGLIHVGFRFESGGTKILVFEMHNRDE
jgi:D-glycero-alpha-D-manno-heptose-7-phosphate kinase